METFHFSHDLQLFKYNVHLCFVREGIEAGLKLGNKDGSKRHSHTEDKQPVDNLSWYAR